jgi:hypothetical protein
MNAYGEVDVEIHVFLTPLLFCEKSASGPGLFNPEEICSYA